MTPKSSFEAQLLFSSADSSLNISTTTKPNNTSSNLSSLCSKIQNRRFPKVLGIIGPFAELSKDLEEALNCDFSCPKYLLTFIPDLFVGGIVLIVTSCELYARDANIDERLESNRNKYE